MGNVSLFLHKMGVVIRSISEVFCTHPGCAAPFAGLRAANVDPREDVLCVRKRFWSLCWWL